MQGEPIHPAANMAATEMEKHKHLDHEIRDMIHGLTKRLAELHHRQPHGNTSHHLGHQDDDHHGLNVITLAGSNQGATMHGELMDDKSPNPENIDPYEALGTNINSNFQAINNSVMMGGSYITNDPGVHLDISDVMDHPHLHHDHDHRPGQKHEEGEKKGKEKHKDNGKSMQLYSDKSD